VQRSIECLRGMLAHVPMVYNADGSIDEEGLRRNIRRLTSEGIEAIYILGSSGEFFNVSAEESRRVVRLFVEEAGARILKVAGCGLPCLGDAIKTARWLNASGIDALMVIPPYFIPLNSEERIRSIREIAAACPDVGIVHYNTSYAPGVQFTVDDYVTLGDVPNFWGTKQGTVTTEFWQELKRRTPKLHHLTLDDWLVRAMKLGGYGSFSLITSFSPKFALRWFEACAAGNWQRAEAMDEEWTRFMDRVYMPISRRGYSDVAVDKALIDCFGVLTAGDPRSPLNPVSREDRDWATEQISRQQYFQSLA
jgi:dihydrodipicolinate synthase/N-acetylneuraminate lyase